MSNKSREALAEALVSVFLSVFFSVLDNVNVNVFEDGPSLLTKLNVRSF